MFQLLGNFVLGFGRAFTFYRYCRNNGEGNKMSPIWVTILTALITGGLSLIGVIITVNAGNEKTLMLIKMNEAVQDERIKELTREVRKHNNFAEKIPYIEGKIEALEKRKE